MMAAIAPVLGLWPKHLAVASLICVPELPHSPSSVTCPPAITFFAYVTSAHFCTAAPSAVIANGSESVPIVNDCACGAMTNPLGSVHRS